MLMKELDNKTFIMEDGTQYEVIENVNYNGKVYLYLVNINDEMDSIFKQLKSKDNELFLEDIDSNLFKEHILELFLNKFKDY